MLRKVMLLSICGVALTVVAQDMTVDEAKLKLIRSHAERGQAQAQYLMGSYFLDQVKQDPSAPELAVSWLTKAAEQSHPKAALKLGEIYYYGDFGYRDFAVAVKWYQIAAAEGDEESMDYLGLLTVRGLGGLVKDCNKANEWYDKAFRGGFTDSLNNLIFNLATNEDASCRDSKRAVEYAEMAMKTLPSPEAGWLDTFAAAFAADKQFHRAVELQQRAIELVLETDKGNTTRIDQFQSRLQSYRNKKSWHRSSDSDAEDMDSLTKRPPPDQ